jgi:hypothetical protein
MDRIELAELRDLVDYERVRESMRAEIIDLKRTRRLALGDSLSLLFENRATVLFQIQEMIRVERIVDEPKLQAELDAYNDLIPAAGELSATLFIELPELARMTAAQARVTVNQFQGLDRERVRLVLGDRLAIPAQFEPGHSNEEKLAAVQYLRFELGAEAGRALADPAQPAGLVVDHPHYQARAELGPELRAQLLEDLAS